MIQKLMVLLFFAGLSLPNGLWRGEQGRIKFESDAPLEVIKASSHSLRGLIDPNKNTFAFTVRTQTFQGFNSPLQQEHFHENYMQSAVYPTASFSGKFIERIAEFGTGSYDVRAKGMLLIHGIEVERIIKCHLEIDGGNLRITSHFLVPLSDHDIKIPQVVHQKIAEEIMVDVDILMIHE